MAELLMNLHGKSLLISDQKDRNHGTVCCKNIRKLYDFVACMSLTVKRWKQIVFQPQIVYAPAYRAGDAHKRRGHQRKV